MAKIIIEILIVMKIVFNTVTLLINLAENHIHLRMLAKSVQFVRPLSELALVCVTFEKKEMTEETSFVLSSQR